MYPGTESERHTKCRTFDLMRSGISFVLSRRIGLKRTDNERLSCNADDAAGGAQLILIFGDIGMSRMWCIR